MSLLSPEEIERGLVAAGVPRAKAKAMALGQRVIGARPGAVVEMPALAPSPVRLRIPWSALVSDNDKYTPAIRKGKPTLLLTDRYREAKAAVTALARDEMAGRSPMTCPLAIHARVYVPNGARRDAINFSKCAHDALSGVVYADDTLLHEVRWTRAGVDVDAPRAEITVTPLAA